MISDVQFVLISLCGIFAVCALGGITIAVIAYNRHFAGSVIVVNLFNQQFIIVLPTL